MKTIPAFLAVRRTWRVGVLLAVVSLLTCACDEPAPEASPADSSPPTATTTPAPAPAGEPLPPVSTQSGDEAEAGSLVVREVSFRERRLVTVRAGSAKAPAVLLLHGKGATSQMWVQSGTMALLARAGYHAVAVDLPGSGGSQSVKVPPARFLGEVLATLGLQDPVVVAASTSAAVVVPVLAQGRNDAGIRAAVFVAPVMAKKRFPPLGKRRPPTLFVLGEHDRKLSVAEGQRLAKGIKKSQVAVIPGAGHEVVQDAPHAFHDALISFLSSVR